MLVPVRIALMKNMAVVPEAEELSASELHEITGSAVCSAMLAVLKLRMVGSVVVVQSQGFSKSSSAGQPGGGTMGFKECTGVMQCL